MKKHKNKLIIGAVITAILVFVFWYGGDAPGLRGWKPEPKMITKAVEYEPTVSKEETLTEKILSQSETEKNESEKAETEKSESEETNKAETDEASDLEKAENLQEEPEKTDEGNTELLPGYEEGDVTEGDQKVDEIPIKEQGETATEENKPQSPDNTALTPDEKVSLAERIADSGNVSAVEKGDRAYSVQNGMVIDEATGKDKYLTAPVPEGKPLPIEPQDAVISDKEFSCTLSVRCDTILENIGWLDKEKVSIVPKDGVIFAEKTVTFYEGESVFNILLREMKRNKIHMEFENTPIYNSAYIEGIANLYEFDCGELSGWMYKVNGWFPNYGCSRYQLKESDKVEWVYTCDLGVDVGGYFSIAN